MEIIANQSSVKLKEQGDLPRNLICFSHLRWDFVFQRPQHLLTRFANALTVYYIEEPVFDTAGAAHYTYLNRDNGIVVMVPHLAPGQSPDDTIYVLKKLLDQFLENKGLDDVAFWYYTPMALEFSRKHNPKVTIFDCMDELSAFKFAPEKLKSLEKELLQKADIVFTGGNSLYEAKKKQHNNIYPFPSSIDKKHFAAARTIKNSSGIQADRLKPKLGFYGVIDERFDIDLIREIADSRPEWEIILIGPVVKIDPQTLPQNANISYLGSKSYQELPAQMANWDIALIPFLLNESTKFISPTKTPEYLAAGLPVISTPITDVVNPYGINKLVHIGQTAEEFIIAAELVMSNKKREKWLKEVDAFLDQNSWDLTCERMLELIKETTSINQLPLTAKA